MKIQNKCIVCNKKNDSESTFKSTGTIYFDDKCQSCIKKSNENWIENNKEFYNSIEEALKNDYLKIEKELN